MVIMIALFFTGLRGYLTVAALLLWLGVMALVVPDENTDREENAGHTDRTGKQPEQGRQGNLYHAEELFRHRKAM